MATLSPSNPPETETMLALAIRFAELGQRLVAAKPAEVFDVLAETALAHVPGANAASITTLRHGKLATVSATHDRARQADRLQYQLGSGPCVDAVLAQPLYRPTDLRHDKRWPDYGARAADELGWNSMLSRRLSSALMDDAVIAGINLYAEQRSAFDERAVRTSLLLATHGTLLMAATIHRDRAANLERAQRGNREIGVAMGILMATHKVTREQAFDLLRIASQHSNRKLAEIALEVGDTGHLDIDVHPPHAAD